MTADNASQVGPKAEAHQMNLVWRDVLKGHSPSEPASHQVPRCRHSMVPDVVVGRQGGLVRGVGQWTPVNYHQVLHARELKS